MMEKVWYESRPFLYLGLAIFALKGPYASSVGHFSGALLIIAATTVFSLRAKARGLI